MARWNGFRTAPPCLLRESGEFVDTDALQADPVRAHRIVLGRALCHFEAFPARVGLAGDALERAARLHAEAHCPFPTGDFALFSQPGSVAIWHWDRGRVEAALDGRRPYRTAELIPEGALQTAGDGCVLIDLIDGQEAQCWRAGALQASLWRRRGFSAAQWEAFAAGAPGEQDATTELPLPRAAADFRTARPNGRRLSAALGWGDLERSAWIGAVLVLACAAYFAGQAMQFTHMRQTERAVDEKVASPEERAVAGDAAVARAFASAAPKTNHLLAAADALKTIEDFGAEVVRWKVNPVRFEAALQDVAPEALADIAAQLEDEARLADVEVERNRDGVVVVADVFPPGGPQ